jgi:hypothetical protein
MKNKGSLHIWCVGYWEDGKFKVPVNLYHLKFHSENIFLFVEQLSRRMKLYGKDWIPISENSRKDLVSENKLERMLNVCDDEITNDGQKETTFDFQTA